MFSYQFMRMNMQDNRLGRENIEREAILEQYMMAPTSMNMWMHMLGGMYAVTDKITLMGMLPYVSNQMEMTDRMVCHQKCTVVAWEMSVLQLCTVCIKATLKACN
jgi:hypothetical protein